MRLFLLFAIVAGCLFAINLDSTQLQNKEEFLFLKKLDIEDSFFNNNEYKDFKTDYYTYKKEQLISILSNASYYFPLIQKILEKEGVPRELVYVAMAESAFKTRAYSSMKAVGIWQFMPYTAKIYGLRVDEYIDERRDPIKSTYAAIKYLKHAKKRFGKWYLAIMAYNCGGGRVNWAIKKLGDDSLTALLKYREKSERFACPRNRREKCQPLPKETREYIRKILAIATITQNPQTLNTLDASYLLNRGTSYPMATVNVKAGTTLREIARSINMREKKLRSLNASLKYSFVPPYVKSFDIYIPYEKLADFKENFKPKPNNQKYVVYRVKKGDNLGSIARKFGVRYKMIKDFNGLKSNLISLNQKLIIPATKTLILKHKVASGDTLISIAKRYNTTVDGILRSNNRKKRVIYVGEYLEIIPR